MSEKALTRMAEIPIVGESRKRPWWGEAQNALWQFGPLTLAFLALLGVGLGWFPSPLLTALNSTEKTLSEARDALSRSDKSIDELRRTAELHAREFQIAQLGLLKSLRQICRNTAKNPQANERCDEI